MAEPKWRIEKIGRLTLVFSPLLSEYRQLVHAFTTRLGGNSPKPIDSFNLSLTRNVEGSKNDAVQNRRSLCRALKLDPEKLVVPYQTHSKVVKWLDKNVVDPKADGLATAVVGLPVLLQFADCVPVILYDTAANAFAVLHAGWRGTASGIVTRGLELLLKKTGSTPGDIAAAIGPAIGSCCYPTGPEVPEGLSAATKNLKGLVRYRKGVPHPDLKAVNARQLEEAGVKRIDVCPLCTSCNPRLFYSHRKSRGHTGLQGAIAALMILLLLVSVPPTPADENNADAPNSNTAKTQPKEPKVHLKALTPKLAQPAVPEKKPAVQPSTVSSSLDQLEQLTYGALHSSDPVEQRLSMLEQSVFNTTYEFQSIDERIRHLLMTLLGDDSGGGAAGQASTRPADEGAKAVGEKETATADDQGAAPESDAALYKEMPAEELYRFALAQINAAREEQGMRALQWDETALKVAAQHAQYLCSRRSGGFSSDEDNPDLSYTKFGGTDALTESIVAFNVDEHTGNNKATVLKILQAINKHQDDRDSVFSPDATHFGLAFGTSANNKLIACVETVTKHAAMHSIPKEIHPGEKIEVKGVVMEPYHFKLISVAWEGEDSTNKTDIEDAEESAALYFPPLDYAAYGQKAQRGEHDKLIGFLRITGVVAAIAGGMFIPPIAIAAPLIAMSGSMPSEPHAISEIPLHGGVKVTGGLFYATIPVSHQNKEGLYYVTVWASLGENHRPVPVSRRVIIAKAETGEPDDSIKTSSQEKVHTLKAVQ